MSSGKPPKKGIEFDDFEEGDRLFQESFETMEVDPSLTKDREPPPVPRGAAKSRGEKRFVDLHRLTLEAAKARVDAEIASILGSGKLPVRLKIITGKGLHSGPGGSVLPREIHSYVSARYATHILSIDDSPSDVAIGGVPLRGYFSVTIGRR